MKTTLLFLAASAAGCATPAQLKCHAVRSDVEGAAALCSACLSRVEVHGNADVCQEVCAAPGRAAPVAMALCASADVAAKGGGK